MLPDSSLYRYCALHICWEKRMLLAEVIYRVYINAFSNFTGLLNENKNKHNLIFHRKSNVTVEIYMTICALVDFSPSTTWPLSSSMASLHAWHLSMWFFIGLIEDKVFVPPLPVDVDGLRTRISAAFQRVTRHAEKCVEWVTVPPGYRSSFWKGSQ